MTFKAISACSLLLVLCFDSIFHNFDNYVNQWKYILYLYNCLTMTNGLYGFVTETNNNITVTLHFQKPHLCLNSSLQNC